MRLGNQEDIKVVTAANGVTYLVRIVRKGDSKGLNWCLTHGEGEDAINWNGKPKDAWTMEPVVEFYDARSENDTNLGYFVSSYYASTLLATDKWSNRTPGQEQGLDLMGGKNDWKIDGKTMHRIEEWVKSRLEA